MTDIKTLINTLPQTGSVDWIGVRPGKKTAMNTVQSVEVDTHSGLTGDRYQGRSGHRQVTLIQAEHLAVIASCLGLHSIQPDLLRRNIVIRGINLLALKDKSFYIGSAIFQMTGLCHPCSYMEKVLGPGGYNAMRGHGGITARVIQNGTISLNDKIGYLKKTADC